MGSGPDPSRFLDGGTDTEPPARDRPPRVLLERVLEGTEETFRLGRRIGYDDVRLGVLLVPADLRSFSSDLTSVPALFTWLVPRTGAHLTAALVHDGLVHAADEPASYVSVEGHVVDRVSADRVFRDAMRDSRTRLIRRWLIWSAVSLATTWWGSASWSRATHLRQLAAAGLGLAVVGVLGVVATLDLLDVVDVLPWMGRRPWWAELAGGFAAAVVIPVLLGLTWGRLRAAGVITLLALALLMHVTAVLAVLAGAYLLAERIVSGPARAVPWGPRRSP